MTTPWPSGMEPSIPINFPSILAESISLSCNWICSNSANEKAEGNSLSFKRVSSWIFSSTSRLWIGQRASEIELSFDCSSFREESKWKRGLRYPETCNEQKLQVLLCLTASFEFLLNELDERFSHELEIRVFLDKDPPVWSRGINASHFADNRIKLIMREDAVFIESKGFGSNLEIGWLGVTFYTLLVKIVSNLHQLIKCSLDMAV